MRDPRVGTFGVIAVVLALLLAWSLLSGLSGLDCLRAALVGHVLGRWSTLPLVARAGPARPEGKGTLLARRRRGLGCVGTAVAVAVALVAGARAGRGGVWRRCSS